MQTLIPLAAYSHFSLMWGTASPAELCRAARELGYTRLALTDRDNLYGLWPFLKACEAEGLSPIVGAELSDPATGQRAIALVETGQGFRHLCSLISQRHLNPDFSLEREAAGLAGGLLFLTGDPDLLRALHEAGVRPAAAALGLPTARAFEVRKIARDLDLPLAAVPAAVFVRPEDRAVHCLLRAIAGNTSLSRLRAADLAPAHAYLAPPAEYARRFGIWPEALAATHELAERCAFTGPDCRTVLPPWTDTSGRDAAALLRQAAYAGARRRYGDLSKAAAERLEHELRIIDSKGFSGYFLVVQNIVQRSPRICGRGSGAASLVAYALGITNVCPLKHNLYFERFLNPGRSDPPDIDVDFAWDERDAVLESVLQQYAGRAAMVCNHVCFQPRMAIREVAKVFGLTDREIGQVSKRLPWLWHAEETEGDLQSRLQNLPELKTLDFAEPWPKILGLAQKIMGVPRYISVHVGGVVITPGPIAEHAPLERAPKGVPVLQWEKDGTEDRGLVKIDLLGNRSLAVIRDALANVRANGLAIDGAPRVVSGHLDLPCAVSMAGGDIPAAEDRTIFFCEGDESRWEPEDDPDTQRAVALGKTMGCFYIESPAMRLLQQKTGKGDFEHLVIHSSIIRPAANEFIREYVRRLKGGAWEPLHPLLADVLDETFGIMVYQEDVSKTAVALAGFSHAEADGLRKILAKKDRSLRLRDYQERFFAGSRARGVDEARIRAIWTMMLSFDGYSFCKPHSASYARVSFQAAYLKVHFPAEFMAAVISNQGGFYSTFAYVSESRRLGLAILHPDVNESQIRWQGQGRALRAGLLSIRSLSAETQNRIVSERSQRRFRNFGDFLDRVEPDAEEGRALIDADACASLAPGQDPAGLAWQLSAWQQRRAKSAGGQQARELFDPSQTLELPYIPAGQDIDRLRREFAALGFLCSRHPMTLFAQALARWRPIKAADLGQHVGQRVRVAGWLITGKVVPTKRGEPMEFITFEDETGLMETTFFPDAYARFCDRLSWNRPYLLSGTVDEDFGAITLTVDQAIPLAAGG